MQSFSVFCVKILKIYLFKKMSRISEQRPTGWEQNVIYPTIKLTKIFRIIYSI